MNLTHYCKTWTFEELVLVLDLYFGVPSLWAKGTAARIEALCKALNALPTHPEKAFVRDFRTPNSVNAQLLGFRALDPRHPDMKIQPSQMLCTVWDQFAIDREGLRKVAQTILDEYTKALAV